MSDDDILQNICNKLDAVVSDEQDLLSIASKELQILTKALTMLWACELEAPVGKGQISIGVEEAIDCAIIEWRREMLG